MCGLMSFVSVLTSDGLKTHLGWIGSSSSLIQMGLQNMEVQSCIASDQFSTFNIFKNMHNFRQ